MTEETEARGSRFEAPLLALPFVAALSLAALSFIGMFVVMGWTAAGLIAFKVNDVRIALAGRGPEWTAGWRRLVLVSHRLCLWPYYFILRLREVH